jgi:hypothetical protein
LAKGILVARPRKIQAMINATKAFKRTFMIRKTMRAIEASRMSSISILLSMGNLLFISVERRAPPQSPSQICSIMFFMFHVVE